MVDDAFAMSFNWTLKEAEFNDFRTAAYKGRRSIYFLRDIIEVLNFWLHFNCTDQREEISLGCRRKVTDYIRRYK